METFVTVIGFLLTGVILMISFFVKDAWTSGGKDSSLNMGQRRHKRNTRVLWGLILLAIVYIALLRYLHTLTGIAMLDGSIGVLLGLYICAHPAANAVNILFFERDTLRQISERSIVQWLVLNFMVLLAGWMVIFFGIIRLVD